ncbi:hypothetical protein AAF712_011369 [Marasmius tenuissimus]|uniref:Transmembrane protein n=1 Tax=Marasmius tenuissimus TaxID=585030 RepID=A0ABR2ZJN2_9AGAR
MFTRLFGKQQEPNASAAPAPAHLQRWDSASTVASFTQSVDLKSTSSDYDSTSQSTEELPKEIEPWAALLFKYGFFFPLFWVFGAMILRSPVELGEPDVDLETGKRKEWTKEQVDLFERTRECERKWAKRCLWALIILSVLCLIGLVVGLSVGLTVGRR